MSITREQIGYNVYRNIETIRKVMVLNQEQFASFVNVKLPTFKTYIGENNKRNFPPPELLLKLSDFSGFSINKFYSEILEETNTIEEIKNSIVSSKKL